MSRDTAALARRNVLQQTALHHAVAAGRHASVGLLRTLGARVLDKDDAAGNSMLNYATRWLGEGLEGGAVWRDLRNAERQKIEEDPETMRAEAKDEEEGGEEDGGDEDEHYGEE